MSVKILLADDSMTAQNMGKKILTDAGFDVTPVSNGAAAWKKITAGAYDLLLLDVVMPGYSGPEICGKARALKAYAKTPILLTIGKMETGEFKVEDAPKYQADGVIVKPFEASDLVTAVQKLTAGAAKAAAEVEKTVKIKAVAEETDKSFKEWAAAAPEAEHEAPKPVPAVEMTAEAAAAPAFDVAAAGPSSWDQPAAQASGPAFDLNAAVEASTSSGAAAAFGTPGQNASALDLGLGGSAAGLSAAAPEPAAPTFELESTPEVTPAGPVAVAPGIEFTSAAPVNIEVAPVAELEPDTRETESSVPLVVDPNFMSDRSQMVNEFATKFSPTGGEEVSVGIVGDEASVEPAVAEEVPAAFAPAGAASFEAAPVQPVELEPAPVAEGAPAVEEPPAAAITPPVRPHSAGETAKLSPWVDSPAAAPAKSDVEPVVESRVEEPAQAVVEAPPAAEPEPQAAPAVEEHLVAHELEQAFAVPAAAPEESAAPVAQASEPLTVSQSLEQSLEPAPVVEEPVAEAPQPEAPKHPAGDLEFANALEAAIASAPVADAEPQPAEAELEPSALAAAAAVASAGQAASASIAEQLAGVDPEVVSKAVDRVLSNAKAEIIAEILKEMKK